MRNYPDDLTALQNQAWSWLEEAVRSAQHPFHALALSSVQQEETGLPMPRTRTVILRHVDRAAGELTCHTDVRCGKVAELRQNPFTVWHGYAVDLKAQLRLSGLSAVHHGDERAGEAWARTALTSRRCYTAPHAPGTVVPGPSSGLPPELEGRVPTVEESEAGWPHFAVIVTRIETIEWLDLASTGNRRARFIRRENSFAGEWLIP